MHYCIAELVDVFIYLFIYVSVIVCVIVCLLAVAFGYQKNPIKVVVVCYYKFINEV